jgi:hypothetical protein
MLKDRLSHWFFRGMSSACFWQDNRTSVGLEELCDVCGPQFNTSSDMAIKDMFESCLTWLLCSPL